MPTQVTEEWCRICSTDELAAGSVKSVKMEDLLLALYNVDGRFYATTDICTHAFALLSDGWLEDEIIECPLHGGQFNICTGKAVGDPAEIDLRTFPVRVVDGYVEVLAPRTQE